MRSEGFEWHRRTMLCTDAFAVSHWRTAEDLRPRNTRRRFLSHSTRPLSLIALLPRTQSSRKAGDRFCPEFPQCIWHTSKALEPAPHSSVQALSRLRVGSRSNQGCYVLVQNVPTPDRSIRRTHGFVAMRIEALPGRLRDQGVDSTHPLRHAAVAAPSRDVALLLVRTLTTTQETHDCPHTPTRMSTGRR